MPERRSEEDGVALAGPAWWKRGRSGGHSEVLHNMLDSGFRAAVYGIQREWSWWCGSPAGTGVWQVGWNKERFMRQNGLALGPTRGGERCCAMAWERR